MAALGSSLLAGAQNSSSVSPISTPEPIYSKNPTDPWNRIFNILFSRRIKVHLSDQFPEGAPFIPQRSVKPGNLDTIHISTKVFEREEIGDRAIDPLYPSFVGRSNRSMVLAEPLYSEFAKALQEAIDENTTRPAVAKALMQSDLWATYDILFHVGSRSTPLELEQHRQLLSDLVARLMKKIALTPQEIKSLPKNYSFAVKQNPLPDLFRKKNGWIEVQWLPQRLHDDAVDYRRVSRVFLKPTHAPRDIDKFLNARLDLTATPDEGLDGVALVIQLLLIDSQGKLETTGLTTDVQIRLFPKTTQGTSKKTQVQMYEISRKLLLQKPGTGGLVREEETSSAYLPSAGNDYGFASRQTEAEGLPVQVQLRTRCALCHGSNLTHIMTFAMMRVPPVPLVRQLNPAANEAADFDISKKASREDFKALSKYFMEGKPN